MEFEKRTDDDGEAVECDSCRYAGRVADFKNTPCESGARDFVFCEVCANTHLSLPAKYPFQCPDERLYKSIAILGNMLLEAIRDGKTNQGTSDADL